MSQAGPGRERAQVRRLDGGGDPDLRAVVAAIERAVAEFAAGPNHDELAISAMRPRPLETA
jgi:hypothetical protein